MRTPKVLSRPVLALTAACLGLTGTVLVAPPALAAVTPAASGSDIQSAWSAGATAQLTSDVTLPVGQNLTVTSTMSVLDLNGHVLAIPSPSDDVAGINIVSWRGLTVRDTAGGGALIVSGGRGAAGLGGYGASYGNNRDCGALVVEGAHVVATGGPAFTSSGTARAAGAGIGGGGGFGASTWATGGYGCAVTIAGS